MAIKTKILHIFKEGEEQRFTLDKEKIFIGRDKSCDVVLNHPSISRRHAAIVCRYDNVYIENISSSGSLVKNGEPIEYSDMQESQDIVLGPYSLHWRYSDAATQPSSTPTDDPEQGLAAAAPAEDIVAPPVPALEGEAAPDSPAVMMEATSEERDPAPAPADENRAEFAVVSADDKTQIAPAAGIRAVLKVVKGEVLGREIRLDNGLSWIVGRSAKCHIQVDNAKLSRQHFKILKIGNSFRVEDLGSANGTRVNGVAVTDAPLQAFDTIQAGPVEVQFLMVNSSVQAGAVTAQAPVDDMPNAPMVLENVAAQGTFDGGNGEAQDKTLFSPPALFTGGQENTRISSPPPDSGMTSAPSGGAEPSPAKASPTEKAREKWEQVVIWFNEQPKQKKILYGSALAILLLALLMSLGDKPKPATEVAVVAPAERTPASQKLEQANAASSPDISPEFTLLTAEKQNEIRDLYAKAEQARRDKDWRTAFDAASKILKTVKRFKNATEILDEAQTYLNEDNIGSISKSLSNVQEAAHENEEQLKLLVESGEKALAERRWDDALEAFSKAMNLDPKNKRASQGFAAANAKDSRIKVELPQTPVFDPDAEMKQVERDEVDGLKKQFQEAKAKMNDGKFREGLPILKNLQEKIEDRLHDYNLGRRAPASVRDEFRGEVKQLQTRVSEGLEAVKTHLRAEYQTQLSDAEQFESNRQYVQAREIYDRIIRTEPGFDEAIEIRAKLYTKILAEAKSIYQEALIYESVGDLDNAIEGYQKTRDLLTNVKDSSAIEYYRRSNTKLRKLER